MVSVVQRPIASADRVRARAQAATSAAVGVTSAPCIAMAAAMATQGADVAPTAAEVAACARARTRSVEAMRRWTALTTTGLAALNAKRRAAGQSPIVVPD